MSDFRCPACGLPPRDVAGGHHPFDRRGDGLTRCKSMAVSASCSNGHQWFESATFDEQGRITERTTSAAVRPVINLTRGPK